MAPVAGVLTMADSSRGDGAGDDVALCRLSRGSTAGKPTTEGMEERR